MKKESPILPAAFQNLYNAMDQSVYEMCNKKEKKVDLDIKTMTSYIYHYDNTHYFHLRTTPNSISFEIGNNDKGSLNSVLQIFADTSVKIAPPLSQQQKDEVTFGLALLASLHMANDPKSNKWPLKP